MPLESLRQKAANLLPSRAPAKAGAASPQPAAPVPAPRVAPDSLSLSYLARNASDIAKEVARQVPEPMRPGNKVELYVDGREAYPQMRALIAQAKQRIDMEFFAWHNDSTGREMAQALIAKAKQGVQVNVLVDRLSNLNNDVLEDMKKGGVNVRAFTNGHQYPLLHPGDITDHRKILLVDGQAGMTGGMNIGERYEHYWHDFMVKIQGPTLQDLYTRFKDNWKMSGGPEPREVAIATQPQGTAAAQVVVTSPSEDEIRRSLLTAFDKAKRSIQVNSPYFIDAEIVEALKRAAQCGVEVSAVIPEVGDNPFVDMMNQTVTNELLAAGVKVRLYDTRNPELKGHDHEKDRFDHGKVAVVDDVWTSIGTANADTRSMKANQEINLQIDSPEFAKQVQRRIFDADAQSRAKEAKPQEFSTLSKPPRAILNSLRSFF